MAMSDTDNGSRWGVAIPAWGVSGLALCVILIQAIVVAGGDYNNAVRIVYLADRERLLSIVICEFAIIVGMILPPWYCMIAYKRSDMRNRIGIGVAINLFILPFCPLCIAIASCVIQGVVLWFLRYESKVNDELNPGGRGKSYRRFEKDIKSIAFVVSAVVFLFVSVVSPSLMLGNQVTFLKNGESVVGPVVGESEIGVVVLDHRIKQGDRYVYSEGESETVKPRLTMVLKSNISEVKYCGRGIVNEMEPAYAFVLKEVQSGFYKKGRGEEKTCSQIIVDYSKSKDR
jgi:hypothetical protein